MNKRCFHTPFLRGVVVAVMTALLFSCSMIGVGETDVDPSSELQTQLDTVKKELDKSKKEYENIGGDLSVFEARLSTIENTIINIQTQITNSVQNNESLKSLMITAAIIWGGFIVLKFILHLVNSIVAPGTTIKNIMFPWRMVKR